MILNQIFYNFSRSDPTSSFSRRDGGWRIKQQNVRKICEYQKNVLSLHPRYKCKMDITFEKDYLRELFYDGVASDKQHRYQPDVVRRYVRVVNILDSVDKPADLFRYRSLHYEKLVGDKAGLESVRVNDKYRIEFRTSSNGTITICNIIELSNHYK